MRLHGSLASSRIFALGSLGSLPGARLARLPQLGNLGVCFLIAQTAQNYMRG
jgi:hypothetical protein